MEAMEQQGRPEETEATVLQVQQAPVVEPQGRPEQQDPTEATE